MNIKSETLAALASVGIKASKLDESLSRATWRDLHNERKNLRRGCKAILNAAEKDGRELTDAERDAFDIASASIENITDELDLRRDNGVTGANAFRNPGSGASFPAPSSNEDALRKIALTRDEKFVDRVGASVEGPELRDLVRASVTGEWNGLSEFQSSMSSGSGVSGGFMVPTMLSARIIDAARSRARVIEAGALTVPMEAGTVSFATIESQPEPDWRGEHAPVVERDLVLGERVFKAQTLAVLVRSSIELVEDAPNFEAVVTEAIAEELALKLDRMALIGTGVGEPLGLFNTDGINRTSLDAGISNYASMSQIVQQVRQQNAEPGDFIMSARTAGELDRLVDGDSNPLRQPQSVSDRRILWTNQVPDDLEAGSPPAGTGSAIFCGRWSDLFVAIRTNITLEATREGGDAFSTMAVLIRGYLRADAFAIRPAHFGVIDRVTPVPVV